MIAVADTSFIIALAFVTEKTHQACLSIYRQQTKIYLPQSTLAEIGYLLTKAGGNRAAAHFLRSLPVSAKYTLEALIATDLARTAELLDKYADSRVDFVDATVATVAERLNITRILTLDRRDFQIIRPAHIEHFEILP